MNALKSAHRKTAQTVHLAGAEYGTSRKELEFQIGDIADSRVHLSFLENLESETHRSGWLSKKGGIGGKIAKRWCVLIGPLLFYFKTPEPESRAKGVVAVHGATVTRREGDGKKGLNFAFSIATRTREYFFSSEESHDRDEWLIACTAVSKSDFEAIYAEKMQVFKHRIGKQYGNEAPPKLMRVSSKSPRSPRQESSTPDLLAGNDPIMNRHYDYDESELPAHMVSADFTTQSYRENN